MVIYGSIKLLKMEDSTAISACKDRFQSVNAKCRGSDDYRADDEPIHTCDRGEHLDYRPGDEHQHRPNSHADEVTTSGESFASRFTFRLNSEDATFIVMQNIPIPTPTI